MALKATIYKAELAIADMTRHYYQTHSLTLAQHPSETLERMMLRLVAFALCADERLLFGKGISEDSEPDLWHHSLAGEIELWVELGLPEDKLIRRASHRAKQGMILAYGGTVVDKWWATQQKVARELDNLTVVAIKADESQALTKLCQRTMQLQCTIQEGQLWFADNEQSVVINPVLLKVATNPLFTLE
jgi:uncharacterized protein YaeQ